VKILWIYCETGETIFEEKPYSKRGANSLKDRRRSATSATSEYAEGCRERNTAQVSDERKAFRNAAE
jgi:hypothetical protein